MIGGDRICGLGVAFLPEEEFSPHIEEGRLVPAVFRLLPVLPEPPAALARSLVVDALRI